jgi:hypothetical protein
VQPLDLTPLLHCQQRLVCTLCSTGGMSHRWGPQTERLVETSDLNCKAKVNVGIKGDLMLGGDHMAAFKEGSSTVPWGTQ